MTEERLKEILYPISFKGAGKVNTEDALQAMKQVVNEAIMESIGLCYDNLVDKPIIDEIRNLKVK